MIFCRHFRVSANGLKPNDVIKNYVNGISGATLLTNFQRSTDNHIVTYCQIAIKNVNSLFPSKLTEIFYVYATLSSSVNLFVHESLNICSYHIVSCNVA